MLLQNIEIGTGSIVGAGSVVKGVFSNNCMIAGNPARVKKQDIGWKRHKDCETQEEYISRIRG